MCNCYRLIVEKNHRPIHIIGIKHTTAVKRFLNFKQKNSEPQCLKHYEQKVSEVEIMKKMEI